MAEQSLGKTIVIGIGNDQRGDDGVGLWLARRMRERRLPGVAVRELCGSPALLFELCGNAETVCLVDVIFSGAPPGSVFRFDGLKQALPRRKFRSSTHGGGVAEAVELARALNRLPQRLIIYGIEGSSFRLGEEISREVKLGAEKASEAILRELGFDPRTGVACTNGE